jgi:hypothetical protein
MKHAKDIFPQALANILAQCDDKEKEKASDHSDRETVTLIRVKRKRKRAHVRQLTFNL